MSDTKGFSAVRVRVEIETREVRRNDHAELVRFFSDNDRPEVTRQFDPFPLTLQTAREIIYADRLDHFYVGSKGRHVLAFAMLRGWDEGYDVPSLGVLVDYRYQGHGFGRLMTEFSIAEARKLGAPRVRLTVYASNHRAVRLYASLGFVEVDRGDVDVGSEPDVKITMLKRLDGSGE